jgi:hypothetical protein
MRRLQVAIPIISVIVSACGAGDGEHPATAEIGATQQAIEASLCGPVCDPTSEFTFNAAGIGADCSAALADLVAHAKPVARTTCVDEGYTGTCQFSATLTSCQFSTTFGAYYAVAAITSRCSETSC